MSCEGLPREAGWTAGTRGEGNLWQCCTNKVHAYEHLYHRSDGYLMQLGLAVD